GLYKWCDTHEHPVTGAEMRAKPIYLLRGYCSWSVKKVVEHLRWAPNSSIEWREDDFWKQVASRYWGVTKTLNRQEVYDLIKDKILTEDQFFDWLDQQAWDAAQDQLDKDMAALAIKDEERGCKQLFDDTITPPPSSPSPAALPPPTPSPPIGAMEITMGHAG
ncbi:hypothetical protein FRC10_004116, partial [Ceratobasidium sp. 414]